MKAAAANASTHAFIVEFLIANGHAPSVREIAEGLGRSPSSIHRHLRDLEKRGQLRRRAGLARALVVVEQMTEEAAEVVGPMSLAQILEERAVDFESAAREEMEALWDGILVPDELAHAFRAAACIGYAHGLRWAAKASGL